MLENLQLPVFNIIGYSGSGKTTLIEKWIPLLIKEGYQPAYLKHAGHPHSFGAKGKDTTRQFDAGAVHASIYTETHWSLQMRGTIDPLMLQSNCNADLLLLEGFKASSFPKVVLVHPEKGVPEALHWEQSEARPSSVWAYLTPTEAQAQRINEILGKKIAFSRDALEEVIPFLLDRLKAYCLSTIPLKAAVLIGGKSRRMGVDKAWLDYGHGPHASFLFDLLKQHPQVTSACYSASTCESLPSELRSLVILDRFRECGPLGGLLTVMESDAHAAWLIVACDLARLQRELLDTLIQQRNPLKLATTFVQETGGVEPLASIYEPRMRFVLHYKMMEQRYSLQRLLQINTVQHLSLAKTLRLQLENVNTPEQRDAVLSAK
ncbi:molybdopterin-guanine dinucleotide biosynthesis protein B [Deltaproteobacteria bacterium TL4]